MNHLRWASALALLVSFAACATVDVRLDEDNMREGGTPPDAGVAPYAASDVAVAPPEAGAGGCADGCSDAPSCGCGACPSPPVGIAAGGGVACVLRQDQSVWCWGSNEYGQLGRPPTPADQTCGDSHYNPTPQRIAGLAGVASVHVGSSFVCALESDGSVWCWGRNAFDVLGHTGASDPLCAEPGDAGTQSSCNPVPSKVSFPANVRIAAVTTGQEVACALSETDANGNPSSDVYCWGENDHDSVGIGGGVPIRVPTPNKIGGLAGDVVAVDLGDDTKNVCAIRQDGTVWCWGDDFMGRIGVVPAMFPQNDCSNHDCTPLPQQVRVATTPTGAGGDGGTDGGDLGLGDVLTAAQQLQLGSATGCVLRTDRTVWCWGNNNAAGLGNAGPYDISDHPGARPVPGLPSTITRLIRHFAVSLAIDEGGTVWGWGENSYGELGTGAVFGQACGVGRCVGPPLALMSLRDVKELGAGDRFVATIKADNSIWAWGRNDYAQLGHAPGSGGDGVCTGEDAAPCNAAPSVVVLP